MKKIILGLIILAIITTDVYSQDDSKFLITPQIGISAMAGDNDLNKFYSSGVCLGVGGAYLLNNSFSIQLNGRYHFFSFTTLGFEEELMEKYNIDDNMSPFVFSNGGRLSVLDFFLGFKYILSHQYEKYFPYIRVGTGLKSYFETEKEFSVTFDEPATPAIREIFPERTETSLAYSITFGVDFLIEETPLFVELDLQFGSFNDQTTMFIPISFGIVL